jgi:hypothetical protein
MQGIISKPFKILLLHRPRSLHHNVEMMMLCYTNCGRVGLKRVEDDDDYRDVLNIFDLLRRHYAPVDDVAG